MYTTLSLNYYLYHTDVRAVFHISHQIGIIAIPTAKMGFTQMINIYVSPATPIAIPASIHLPTALAAYLPIF
jgi:hypothetical protein